MCDPIAMAGITAASGLYSTYTGALGTAAKNRELEYNARINTNNANISLQEAAYARAQGMRNAAQKGREAGQMIGAQRAAQGASGVLVDTGSLMDTIQDTAAQGARDSMAASQEGDTEAWRHENQAANYRAAAAQSRASKQSVGTGIVGGLLSTAASAGMGYFAVAGKK